MGKINKDLRDDIRKRKMDESRRKNLSSKSQAAKSVAKRKEFAGRQVGRSVSSAEGAGVGLPLPAGWKEMKDEASGETYYYHDDGRTTWEKPVLRSSKKNF